LNEALNYIEGNLIVFTDDDVAPHEDWLVQLSKCAHDHPEFALFGGRILPKWLVSPEPWLNNAPQLGMLYAITDPGRQSGAIDNGLVWGPNMAVRSDIFALGEKFNTTIGPDGTEDYMMGSESEFTRRISKHGVRAWFCADATVEHMIRPNQMTKNWVLKRYFRHGRSSYMLDHVPDEKTPKFFGIERWLYRKLLNHYIKVLILKLTGKRDEALKELTVCYHVKGGLYQAKIMVPHSEYGHQSRWQMLRR
jgi:GT2 family glycosyltransferase